MTPARTRTIVLAALVWGAGVIALVLTSDREDADAVWAVFGPLVIWSFVGTGLFAWRRRPESRTGALMVVLGFAYGVAALNLSISPLLYTVGLIVGGLWGAVFLQLVMAFPSGRLAPGRDRAIVIAGYLIFTLGSIPAMLVAGSGDLGCDDCPANVLLIERDEGLADVLLGLQALAYVALFLVVLVRLTLRWRRTPPLERLQLTPVYACGLITFLLATAATATASPGDPITWAANIALALLPFAFLAGLLRSHVARLDAELLARLEELRASRARLVRAGDAERRRLERDLHDGAQSRLVGIAALLAQARKRVDGDAEAAALLDRAQAELGTSLGELRELARGIHPAVLTERGLEPALERTCGTRLRAGEHRHRRRRAAAGARRDRRLLRRRRGAHERREVRPGERGRGRGPAKRRTGHGRHQRRRHRRRRRCPRLRLARACGPRRGARRHGVR